MVVPGFTSMWWYMSLGKSVTWGMSKGKQSSYFFLNFWSSLVRRDSAANCSIHVLITPMMFQSPVVCTSMLNLEWCSSKCNSSLQCTSFCRFWILVWLSFISHLSCLRCIAGEMGILICELTGLGGFRRSNSDSFAITVQSSASTTILFLMRKSRPRMRSVWRFGQMIALSVQDFQWASGDITFSLQ